MAKKARGLSKVMKLEAMSRESSGQPQKITTRLPKPMKFAKDAVPKAKKIRVPSAPKASMREFPKAGKEKPARAKTIMPPKPKKAK